MGSVGLRNHIAKCGFCCTISDSVPTRNVLLLDIDLAIFPFAECFGVWGLLQYSISMMTSSNGTHICVSKITIIGSDNGLSPGRRQAIIWTNPGILLIGPCGTKFHEILIESQTFSFKKMHFKMSCWILGMTTTSMPAEDVFRLTLSTPGSARRWRHQMETFSALLAICAWNSLVPGEFPTQRPVTRSCDVFFDPCLNKRLNKQSWGWWFQTLHCPLWRQCNVSSRFVRRQHFCHLFFAGSSFYGDMKYWCHHICKQSLSITADEHQNTSAWSYYESYIHLFPMTAPPNCIIHNRSVLLPTGAPYEKS